MIRIRTILHPTDFSEHSERAFQVACSLARASGSRLTVLHVGPIPQLYQKRGYQEEIEEALRRRAASHPGTRIDWLLLAGDAVPEILWLARERQYDLVVMGGLSHALTLGADSGCGIGFRSCLLARQDRNPILQPLSAPDLLEHRSLRKSP